MQIVLILLEALTAAAGLAMKEVDSTAPVSKYQTYYLFHLYIVCNIFEQYMKVYYFWQFDSGHKILMLLFVDIDECERDMDNCSENADCTNNIGSFTCACVHGYSGDGVTCSKLNHCRC